MDTHEGRRGGGDDVVVAEGQTGISGGDGGSNIHPRCRMDSRPGRLASTMK